ncbi:MAG: penicillin-binding protein 2 [Patescibacteria group bacterium]|nr:penicillin-binding protein 2 [Patescibacteria group bacterium]
MLTTAKKRAFKSKDANQVTSFRFSSISATKSENQENKTIWRLMPFRMLVLLVTIIIVGRIFYLQIINASFYSSVSQSNKTRETIIRADRGIVVDRTGKVIIRNKPQIDLWVNLSILPTEYDIVIQQLSKDLNIATAYLQKKIQEDTKNKLARTLLKLDLSQEEAIYFESQYAKYTYIVVEKISSRDNLYPYETATLVGYVSQISQDEINGSSYKYSLGSMFGKTGIEKEYEKYLRGEDGVLLLQVDSVGTQMSVLGKKGAISGDTVELNIEIDLQKQIYNIIDSWDKDHPKILLGGAVVLQDVSNGEIVSLVSYPSYNVSLFSQNLSLEDYDKLVNDPRKPLFNRAISGAFPPGSVFKIITLSAALEERTISAEYQVTVPGYIAIGSYIYRDWKESGHGLVNAEKALAVSSDVYFYALGGGWAPFGITGLGVERMTNWGKKFGLGSVLGIDLPDEVTGFLPSKEWKQQTYGESWYIGDDFITAIGQGFVLTTPLQINSLTATIANGGLLYKPRVVASIKLLGGEVVKKEPVVINRGVVSKETAQTIFSGMVKACSLGGTAYPLFDFVPQVACKTGTAEFGEKLSTGVSRSSHAWITVIAPADNPRYALTVFLEGGGEGSGDAGGVAREILNYMKEQGLIN